MKMNKMYFVVICACITIFHSHASQHNEHHNRLDVMADFAYPVGEVEAVRHEISQGLCFLRQASLNDNSQDFLRAVQALEQADAQSMTRAKMTEDDRDSLQNLLDQINALINSLEGQDHRSNLSSLHDRLQNKVSTQD
jgi:hypothetical protein